MRERLSAVDSLFSASIKSRCQSEHEQEIAPLVRGGKKCRRRPFLFEAVDDAVVGVLFLWFTCS